MSIFVGMHINLDVVSASESAYVGIADGVLTTYRKLNLILCPEMETMIVLSSGRKVHATHIAFTISTKWKTGKDMDDELTSNDIGFLFHAERDGEPYVHGATIWPLTSFPSLSDNAKRRSVSLVLSNLEAIPEYAPPFHWGTGNPNILRIASLEFSIS